LKLDMGYTAPLLDLEGDINLTDKPLPFVSAGQILVQVNLNVPQKPPHTAIIVSKDVHRRDPVDIILYLHGIHAPKIQEVTKARKLRAIIDDTGKGVVFVAPTLGDNSEIGNLKNTAVAVAYLDQVRQFLVDYGPYTSVPKLNNLILAAHSGGGFGMRTIASALDGTITIPEAWGFDCLYGVGSPVGAPKPLTVAEPGHHIARTIDEWNRLNAGSIEKQWLDWSMRGRKFRAFWGGGGTLTRTANLDLFDRLNTGSLNIDVIPRFFEVADTGGVSRITPQPRPVSVHDLVPQTVLKQCIRESASLS
jgi:hypothetical protein